jgi:hypothetical protein
MPRVCEPRRGREIVAATAAPTISLGNRAEQRFALLASAKPIACAMRALAIIYVPRDVIDCLSVLMLCD